MLPMPIMASIINSVVPSAIAVETRKGELLVQLIGMQDEQQREMRKLDIQEMIVKDECLSHSVSREQSNKNQELLRDNIKKFTDKLLDDKTDPAQIPMLRELLEESMNRLHGERKALRA